MYLNKQDKAIRDQRRKQMLKRAKRVLATLKKEDPGTVRTERQVYKGKRGKRYISVAVASREFLGMTRMDIAEVLGLNRRTVYAWFGGRERPSYESLLLLAGMLQVKVERLIRLFIQVSNERREHDITMGRAKNPRRWAVPKGLSPRKKPPKTWNPIPKSVRAKARSRVGLQKGT